MNKIIILQLKNDQSLELQESLHYFGYNKIEFSDSLGDLPIKDILNFVATVIGAGGVTAIITELRKWKKKDIKVEESEDCIKIDCTQTTVPEVIELLKQIHEIQNSNKDKQ